MTKMYKYLHFLRYHKNIYFFNSQFPCKYISDERTQTAKLIGNLIFGRDFFMIAFSLAETINERSLVNLQS